MDSGLLFGQECFTGDSAYILPPDVARHIVSGCPAMSVSGLITSVGWWPSALSIVKVCLPLCDEHVLWGAFQKSVPLHKFTSSSHRGRAHLADILSILPCAGEASPDLLSWTQMFISPPSTSSCSRYLLPELRISLKCSSFLGSIFFYPCLSCVFLCSSFSINLIPSAFYITRNACITCFSGGTLYSFPVFLWVSCRDIKYPPRDRRWHFRRGEAGRRVVCVVVFNQTSPANLCFLGRFIVG